MENLFENALFSLILAACGLGVAGYVITLGLWATLWMAGAAGAVAAIAPGKNGRGSLSFEAVAPYDPAAASLQESLALSEEIKSVRESGPKIRL